MNNNQEENVIYQIINLDKIKYSINDIDQTASVIGCDQNLQRIFIPNSIKYESKVYYVISISKDCFTGSDIESIEFSKESKIQTIEEGAFRQTSIESITIPSEVRIIGNNAFSFCRLQQIEFLSESKLQTIEKNAFDLSPIESITIPSEVTDLKEGWCGGIFKIKRINVSPMNKRYRCHEQQMIIGKETQESNIYENLVFCVRNIKKVIIPNFIKRICSDSFSFSSISSIKIPSEVKIIKASAFSYCKQLQQIEFSKESKLQTIGEASFCGTSIESIIFPSELQIIGKNSFSNCQQLKRIDFSNESKLQTIDVEAFILTSIESIRIPSKVRIIGDDAFNYCEHLLIIEFSENSKLDSINEKFFGLNSKLIVIIPSNIRDRLNY